MPEHPQRLRERAALVTGASSGIGRAIARRFVAEGARVMGFARRKDRLAEAGHPYVVGDIRCEEDTLRAVDAAVSELGALDILVNAAGVIGNDGVLKADPAEWRRIMDVNLEGLYTITRQAAPHLVRRRGNSIVNLSSVTSIRPYPNVLAYCVSKAAVDMLTRCVALELAPHGVRVNAVNPGVVVTELHTVTQAVPDYAAFLERSRSTHPLGRVGEPDDVAALAAFLASEEAGWITGACVNIDGGRQLLSAR